MRSDLFCAHKALRIFHFLSAKVKLNKGARVKLNIVRIDINNAENLRIYIHIDIEFNIS